MYAIILLFPIFSFMIYHITRPAHCAVFKLLLLIIIENKYFVCSGWSIHNRKINSNSTHKRISPSKQVGVYHQITIVNNRLETEWQQNGNRMEIINMCDRTSIKIIAKVVKLFSRKKYL